MNRRVKGMLFAVFFVSGLCSLLYQVVWIRLAFASFGIITQVLSVVISVFMLGLALGSWLGGKYIDQWSDKTGISPLLFYAAAELFIGTGAFLVAGLFSVSQFLLLNFGESNTLLYLLFSALLITVSMLPWCIAMGTTFPFMISYIKRAAISGTGNFSFLYTANVAGAVAGILLTTVIFIENLGFRHTLWLAGALNFGIALLAYRMANGRRGKVVPPAEQTENVPAGSSANPAPYLSKLILFTTGFTSLGMEVAWTRAFTPILGTTVYAFSFLLAGYLLATWIGSSLYRRALSAERIIPKARLLMLLAVFSFLPVVANDPQFVNRFNNGFGIYSNLLMILITIFPFCLVLGYLTPFIIDEYSGGDPDRVGRSYAVNILGCIIGPLIVSYILLPALGVKLTLVIMALPYVVLFWMHSGTLSSSVRLSWGTASCLLLVVSLLWSASYEVPRTKDCLVKRDHAATVVCIGKGMKKALFVNGMGITCLTPITKFMAHLPLLLHKEKSESALVICFGMGTTYRSLLSWDINTTAVELVPSVRDVFGYFFDDAESLARNPKGRIIIDDGRRFLMRTKEKFDIITLDPPPPIEASGSSLLYSKEFYRLVILRLKPNGILQQWFPYEPGRRVIDKGTICAAARSLYESFPYVKAYTSVVGWGGVHFLASMSPIEAPAIEEMVLKMPKRARADLMEWNKKQAISGYLSNVLSKEIPMSRFLLEGDKSEVITDDRPFNEYFLCREQTTKKPGPKP